MNHRISFKTAGRDLSAAGFFFLGIEFVEKSVCRN